ncbi:polyprenyl synthetase family protein [Cryobacterium psychrophilum]|uniref:Polyprenyl synthetase family protein n=1 Tax=Cryobacterium psychrophilum TaxID=41988 RepID=A0A4Y8KTG7_9MICO|nr:polyprenyl synthetase family protein [Cryobacterium psychrophilum]TDW29666.1 geranylgeranyl diphosphate synthase type II [Cryobacterium psychrophilum]TFD81778.1 polyprenyl synthetase family protein [Cryobacterium psychrophilum]
MTPRVSLFRASTRVTEVTTRLADFFDEKQRLAATLGGQYADLWAAARHASEGGKKFRPALVVNTYEALGGDNQAAAVAVATAFELLHTAFLLHDDVIDGDTTRRGQPNLLGTFSAEASARGVSARSAATWGEASAILAGDLLIHAAQGQVARLSVAENKRLALLDLLEECVFVTAAGELADVSFSTSVQVPVLSDVVSMTQWKTAHYSFQAPLQAGAILADASEATVRGLSEFGRNIGIAFQLRDDILGAFGAEDETGKSSTSDLREGKMTLLMCSALQRSDTDELAGILSQAEITASDADRVRQILQSSGARDFIEGLITDYAHFAIAAIDSPAIPSSLRLQLEEVAHKACDRSA